LSCSHNNNILEFLLTLRFDKETINNAADVGYLKWLTYAYVIHNQEIRQKWKEGDKESEIDTERCRQ